MSRLTQSPKKVPSKPRVPRQGTATVDSDDVLPEYDFRDGVRDKYAVRYAEPMDMVRLDPDVAAVFPDSTSVNAALRALAEIAQRHVGNRGPVV